MVGKVLICTLTIPAKATISGLTEVSKEQVKTLLDGEWYSNGAHGS